MKIYHNERIKHRDGPKLEIYVPEKSIETSIDLISETNEVVVDNEEIMEIVESLGYNINR